MPNRRKCRRISCPPLMEGFKPFGIPMHALEPVTLLFEEFEALKLADYENLTQEEAAARMNISRPTFTRLYDKARKTIAKAFAEGKAIIIKGGTYATKGHWYRCYHCHQTTVSIKPLKHCKSCNSDRIESLSETTWEK